MADLLEFNNLFWNVQSAEEDTTLFTSSPKAITELSILGQGTIAVRSKATQALTFVVSPKNKYPSLSLKITQTNYNFAKEDESQKETSLDKDVKHVRLEANPYLPQTATADGTVYWLSIDRSNWILRYGKYYGCNALTILQVSLDEKSGAWLKELANVNVTDEVSPPTIMISPLPVTIDLPPLVVTNELVTLRDLDLAKVTTWANLPEACQNLYHNICGRGVTLETTDFPDLAKAIHRSVTTPGYWGYEKLKSNQRKQNGKDFALNYLRVTIGSSKGNSPGIPFVMEVWPPGHRSVIHDHGDACAVIRVLAGAIHCTWYDSLESGKKPTKLGNPCILRKDQITWLGMNQYQIHHLENKEDWTCVTLQCYEFAKPDNVHDEHFRYFEENGTEKKSFAPRSDCTFADFYTYMDWEWKNKKAYGT